MKKSKQVMLGALFTLAIGSCGRDQDDQWVTGYNNQYPKRDTSFNGNHYRFYNNGWYPVRNGLICPSYYRRPYSYSEISSSGFSPSLPAHSVGGGGVHADGFTSGGFGSSAHGSSSGE